MIEKNYTVLARDRKTYQVISATNTQIKTKSGEEFSYDDVIGIFMPVDEFKKLYFKTSAKNKNTKKEEE